MKNENGMIFPLTVILAFFFFLIFSHQLSLYLDEKKFSIEVEALNQLESIMQMSVKDISSKLSEIEKLDSSMNGVNHYPNGESSYSIYPESAEVVKVIVICTNKDNRVYNANFYYSLNLKKIIKWVEAK